MTTNTSIIPAPEKAADVTFGVAGMTCAACVRRVEKAITKLPGVLSANVNLATNRASIEFLPEIVSEARIRAAILDAGYQPLETPAASDTTDPEQKIRETELASLRKSLTLAVALCTLLVLITMGPMFLPGMMKVMHSLMPETAWNWLALVLVTPVQFIAGWRFYRQGWGELKHLNPGMNTLVIMEIGRAHV
jgi:Cu+-exporting ATPase